MNGRGSGYFSGRCHCKREWHRSSATSDGAGDSVYEAIREVALRDVFVTIQGNAVISLAAGCVRPRARLWEASFLRSTGSLWALVKIEPPSRQVRQGNCGWLFLKKIKAQRSQRERGEEFVYRGRVILIK
jgi:hypothetical protein